MALEKLSILRGNEGGNEGNSVGMRDGGKGNIAVRTAIRPLVSRVKVYLEFPVELVQLAVDVIADEERVPATKDLV